MFILLYYLVLVQVLGVEFSAPAVSTMHRDRRYGCTVLGTQVLRVLEYYSMIQTRGLQYWCLGYCMHTWYY